jgi:hypothetical protein
MLIIFCSNPLSPNQADSFYQAEHEAAVAVGFATALLDIEALVNENNAARATRKIPATPKITDALYRGWMLTPDNYAKLYGNLERKNVRLLTDVQAYRHCHYLPEWYDLLREHTPATVWLKLENGEFPVQKIQELLRPFGNKRLIVKDYVKSRKHDWETACFIPNAVDWELAEQISRRFIQLQGEHLNEGIIYREFVEFERIGNHSKSGMPLTREYRLFFYKGALLYWTAYWDEGEYGETALPLEFFDELAQRVQSHFFTMDVARLATGEWLVVELGDGQVSGLPDNANVRKFYEELKSAE